MIQTAANTGFCPLQNLFCVSSSFDSVNSNPSCFSKTQPLLLAQKTCLQVVGAGAGGTLESSVVTHPRTPTPALLSKKQRQARRYPTPRVPVVRAPSSGGGWAAHDAALCTPGVGLQG